MEDKFYISVYCGPQPPITVNDVDYPNRIVKEQFQLLKDLGVNTIYGHCDIMNTETEEYAFRALEICDELGLNYFVKDLIAREYCSLGEKMFEIYKFNDYRKLSEEEKIELDERFKASILRYKKYKSFSGLIFIDEPGAEMFDGVERASKIFKSVYPDKIFLVNLYAYNAPSRSYQFSWQDDGVTPLASEFKFQRDETRFTYDGFYVHNNVEKYERFVDRFFSKVDANIFSYDLYPFRDYYGYNSLVQRGLYEMPLIAKKYCEKYGLRYWQFLQCGGLWVDYHTKVTTFADVQLSVSLAMALGAKGMQLYTGCFPNDCLPRIRERSGVIDEFGNITNQYDFYRYAFRQAKAVENYIVPATLEKVILDGEYYDKTPDVEALKALEVTDIYKGKFPPYGDYETKEYKELKCVESDFQVLVSCFNLDGKSVFMAVNTSPLIAATATLKFDKEYTFTLIQSGIRTETKSNEIQIRNLPAGENVLIIL